MKSPSNMYIYVYAVDGLHLLPAVYNFRCFSAVMGVVEIAAAGPCRATVGEDLSGQHLAQGTGFNPVRRTKRSRGLPPPTADLLPEKRSRTATQRYTHFE